MIPIYILMATFNGEAYLAEQIECIIGQSYQNWTLYISDDGSEDGTVDVLKYYSNEYDNIHVLDGGTVRVGSALANFYHLLEFTKEIKPFDLYFFADQDDVWCIDKIKLFVERFEYYPPQYCAKMHDWWLALVAARYGKIEFIPMALVKYRQHGGNTVGASSYWQQINPFSDIFYRRIGTAKKHLAGSFAQAKCLLSLEDDKPLQSAGIEAEVLQAYCALTSVNRVQRLKTLFKYRIFKHTMMYFVLVTMVRDKDC